MRTEIEERILTSFNELMTTTKLVYVKFTGRGTCDGHVKDEKRVIKDYNQIHLIIDADDTLEEIGSNIAKCFELVDQLEKSIAHELNHPDLITALRHTMHHKYSNRS